MLDLIWTNEQMLIKIREDRPSQVIHEVLSFKENQFGFYDVEVNMEIMAFETKIKNHRMKLPYPTSAYMELTEKLQLDWRFEN